MPVATVNLEETEKVPLKSLEGAWVELRRMSFGQIMQRRMFTKLDVEMGGKNKDFRGELAMANVKITEFEFKTCVVDHNLEDATGRKLDLSVSRDFHSLHPRVGQEIEKLITDMNDFEEEEENSEPGSGLA
jgi:hypothetical protein